MHAHPCPAVISVQAPGRVVVWGIRGWFAGEPGDGVPKLPLLTWLTPINALFALLCRAVSGLTVAPFPSFSSTAAGDVMNGRVVAPGRRTLPLNKRYVLPPR